MKLLRQQHWHLVTLVTLLGLLYWYTTTHASMTVGRLWGVSTPKWLVFTSSIPIIHQVYVLLCWRSELYYRGLSKVLGKHSFRLYKLGFAILIILRPFSIVVLAFSNRNTVDIDINTSYVLSGLLTIPVLYLFYSVKTYFGFDRAVGIDHFYPDRYKHKSFVKQGIFKYTSNSMYIFGFLILWIPGLLLQSEAAIILALFNHIYIWAHYYFTELPDIKMIYGEIKNREKTQL
ncbi:phosphatidylethanolamine N-methyltransferase family protein [Aestuariivivens insulae]|uniref:phosphatidylethanolamine N-methyltransferase family protein n=1 Tax=Aestuariivivens insulae TaxID=1621988 RepID=UPI001F593532|nr:phosphatidylethanolamine N-methyltransferase family protein [Aestuariivivens insulae]